jgi:rhamnogalacturonan endolyase
MLNKIFRNGLAGALGLLSIGTSAARQTEVLKRAPVAIRQADGGVFTSWRLLSGDPKDIAFNLYRAKDGKPEKVNGEPLESVTNAIDSQEGDAYFVRAIVDGEEQEPSQQVDVRDDPYLEIPLRTIEGYHPGDCSVADLDGDGEYELIVHQSDRARDNSHSGLTTAPILDAYEFDGTFLWRINLGLNIREGEHYTQFLVYDFDGDGCAELACRTADGTRDGTGKIIGDPDKKWRNEDEDSRRYGRVLKGPEFLTIFDGRTGAALKTVDYVPGRDPVDGWGGVGGNGGNDNYGNRADRFLGCVAYLDGERPSLVMSRGVYGRTVLAAWDWRDGKLTSRWVFDSGTSYPPFEDASPYSGQGGHSLAVADVDDDERDEIVYQAMTIDDDGSGLYSTSRRHGDSLAVSDFNPDRPGMELYLVTENEEDTQRWGTPGAGMHDARTGEALWTHSPGVDISEGVAADIDPRHPGAEVWGGRTGLRTVTGDRINDDSPDSEWVIWWDGDLLRETYSGYRIRKWNWEQAEDETIFRAESPFQERQRRFWHSGRPNLTADLIGDWREELLVWGPSGRSLRLYTTTIPSEHRMTCLMQNHQYRMSVALQNVVYNKPPFPSHYIGETDGLEE